jgi:hypothetical protein
MKIPFEDSRSKMKRRWTDIKKKHRARFFEVHDSIDEYSNFSREELLQLQKLINQKVNSFLGIYGVG